MRRADGSLSRRQTLSRAAAAAGAFGLAGCAGVLDRSGDDPGAFPDSPPEGPERPPAWYLEWLPSDHPPWIASDLALVRERRDDVPTEYRHEALSNGRSHDFHGVPLEDVDRTIWFIENGLPTVFLGDVDRDAVADTLARTGYELDGQHAGFRIYERDDERAIAAVGSEALVATQHSPGMPEQDPEQVADARAFVEGLLDHAATEGSDDAEPSSEASAVAEQFGAWPVVGGVRAGTIEIGRDPAQESHRIADPIEGVEATLLGQAFGGADGTGYAARCYHLDEEVGPEERQHIQSYVREQQTETDSPLLPGMETWISRRDAVLEILAGAPLDAHPAHDPDDPVDVVPQVTLAFELDREREELTIRHLAGDSLPLDRTTLGVEFEVLDPLEGTLAAGESETVRVETPELPATVRLIYENRSTSQSRTLASALLEP